MSRLSIGEFSKLTHLSVKTLRHYHDLDLLVPNDVDRETRYRRYDAAQAGTAQLIRRLRALDMPIEAIRTVIAARDSRDRDAVIAAHLETMEAQLEHTRTVVSSLRSLLEQPQLDIGVRRRLLPGFPAIAIQSDVAHPHVEQWVGAAFADLREVAEAAGIEPDGPTGGVFAPELFTEDLGTATVYVPVSEPAHVAGGRVIATTIRGGEMLVATHAGPFSDLDRTYAALGSAANELGAAAEGPIREIYLVGPDQTDDPLLYRTEVCWPLT